MNYPDKKHQDHQQPACIDGIKYTTRSSRLIQEKYVATGQKITTLDFNSNLYMVNTIKLMMYFYLAM